jgi:anti-anti-sigma factor
VAALSIRTSRPLSTSADVVVRVFGEIDAACVGELRLAVDEALSLAGGPVVLDLAGSTFIDAAGLGTLVWFARSTGDAGRAGRLRNVSDGMQRLLDLTGVQRCFEVAPVPA